MNHTSRQPSPLTSRGLLAWACLPLFASILGCGNDLLPVTGTVQVDGQPAEGVILYFHPTTKGDNSFPSSAKSESGGVFTLSTNMEKGISAGTYKISATYPDPNFKPEVSGFGGFGEPEAPPDLFKGKYTGRSSVTTKEINSSILNASDFVIELTTKN